MAQSFVFLGAPEVGEALARNLLEAGYQVAGGIDSADVVITLCSRQSQLEDVYYEAGGVIATAMPGSYVLDLSPATPAFAKELAALATVNDLHAVEAPLVVRDCTAKHAFANPANLIALAAGDEADIETLSPILHTIASTVHVCGASGQGQLAKCAITVQTCAQLAAFMEADALCRAHGAKEASFSIAEMAANDLLVAPGIRNLVGALRSRDFGEACGYSIELLWGELESALAAADDQDLILPQAESALYLFELLATIGGAGMGPAALQLVYCDEETVAEHGLDWKRAEEAYQMMNFVDDDYDEYDDFDDYDDDYDDYDDDDSDGFGMGFGTGFNDWSSN